MSLFPHRPTVCKTGRALAFCTHVQNPLAEETAVGRATYRGQNPCLLQLLPAKLCFALPEPFTLLLLSNAPNLPPTQSYLRPVGTL